MNKKLLAIAVAAGLAVPAAAMADVTIYGKFNMGLGYAGNDGSGDLDAKGAQVMSNSSRIGFKGSEDLGGGISVIWQSESALDPTTGTGSLGARNSFLGLATGFGKVFIGKYDTPSKTNARKSDLFGDTFGDSRTIIRGDAYGLAGGPEPDLDERANNTINYQSPKIAGGLGINLQYVPDENTENDFDDAQYSGAVFWNSGGLYVGGDYQGKQDGSYGLTTNNDDEGAFSLSAKYKFGFGLTLAGFYRDVTSFGTVDGADIAMFGGGAGYTFGKNTIKAQYYTTSEDFDQNAQDAYCIGTSNSCDASVWAIGWDHEFSKQTMMQVVYSVANNDDGVAANPWTGGGSDQLSSINQAGGAGNNPYGFMVGLVHKF